MPVRRGNPPIGSTLERYGPAVHRNPLFWLLLLCFGSAPLFGLVRSATQGSSMRVMIGWAAALALAIAAIALVVRRQRD